MVFSSEPLDLVIGVVFVTGTLLAGAGYGLVKLGVVRFGQNKQPDSTQGSQHCPVHGEVKLLLDRVHTNQIENIQTLKQHERSLESGNQKFDSLFGYVADLREGIGVLMDRTGGRPAAWKGKRS